MCWDSIDYCFVAVDLELLLAVVVAVAVGTDYSPGTEQSLDCHLDRNWEVRRCCTAVDIPPLRSSLCFGTFAPDSAYSLRAVGLLAVAEDKPSVHSRSRRNAPLVG